MSILNFAIFAVLAIIIIFSALGVVFVRKISSSLLCMMLCFLCVSGIFFSLNADFIGASQIILYGVSVAVLMVFAIMLTDKKDDKIMWISLSPRSFFAVLFSVSLFIIMIFSFFNGLSSPHSSFFVSKIHPEAFVSSSRIASELFSSYILPFEVLSLLLLIIIVGAALLAGREEG